MSKKALIVIILIIIVGILWFGSRNSAGGNLISPNLMRIFNRPASTPSEIPTPPDAPKTFKFDSSTDLKMELEQVNPQVLDSDFE